MKRPVIGITPGLSSDSENTITLYNGTLEALWQAGANPVVLPLTSDPAQLTGFLNLTNGILFSGGGDVDPLLFGQYQHQGSGNISPRRDAMELPLARLAVECGHVAVFGICRGFQVLNIALGGDLWQDIPSEYPGQAILHRQKNPSAYPSHPVSIQPDSLLHSAVGTDELLVNSLHHQAIHTPGQGMKITATAPDGIIEATELTNHPFCVGVQWHPERMWKTNDPSFKLLKAFVLAAQQIHQI